MPLFNTANIPASLTVSTNAHGQEIALCADCRARMFLATEYGMRHLKSCETKAQLGYLSKADVASVKVAGVNPCEGQPVERVLRWVRDGAVSVSDAMNLDT
jgi:hypothetical protein